MEARIDYLVLESLLARCRLGDAIAWWEFCGLFQEQLESWARQELRARGLPEDLAADLVQNCLLSLWQDDGQKLADYDPGRACFATYLHHIVRSQARAQAQLQHLRTLSPDLADSFPSRDEEGGDLWLADFLATLSPADREFVAVFLLGEPPPAVSALPAHFNVANWKHKILLKLRDYFAARKAPPARTRSLPPAQAAPAAFEYSYSLAQYVDLYGPLGHIFTVVYDRASRADFLDCIGARTTYTYSAACLTSFDLASLNPIVTTVYDAVPRPAASQARQTEASGPQRSGSAP